MNKLYILTLEKIEQRYTSQWYKQWKQYFSKDFQVEYIDGTNFEDKIKKGRFLDINRTNAWKAEQVIILSELFDKGKIKNGDIFLFADGWHFGVTALKYMSQLQKINIKIFLYMHAGTYDPYDFISQAGLGKWARYDELAWFKACDGIFVATKFHKELILTEFITYSHLIERKIHVVGFPMDWIKTIEENTTSKVIEKENLIVFPHRLDKEKQPEIFDKLSKLLPEYQFIKTLEVTKNKLEYYELLKRAKIVFSASLQETYGIGTVEGLILGCIPIVPDRLSYSEMYDDLFRYNNIQQAKKMIKKFIENYDINYTLIKALKYNKAKVLLNSIEAFNKMSEVMNGKR